MDRLKGAFRAYSIADIAALVLSLLTVLVAWWVTVNIFESMAHLEDEMAYVWQAQAVARGQLTLPTPPEPKSFLVPFVVDYNGLRFGKYPLGWPAVLAVGVRLGLRSWINPLLAGLGVWLIYRLGKRTMGETVGLLAAGLTLISPFFLMNSGSLLSHPLGMALSAAFALTWLDAFAEPVPQRRWASTLLAALAMGALALTRPFTAVGVALPFAVHAVYLLLRGSNDQRKRLIVFGLVALLISLLYLLWQWAVTGDPFLNPYTLWWEYDTIGFGPGVGRASGGHSLHQAYINTRYSLQVGVWDFFGWGPITWGLLAIGAAVVIVQAWRRNWRPLLLSSVFPSLVLVYMAYWIGSYLFGPRYYYEGLFSLSLLAGAAIAFVAGWPLHPGEPFPNYSGWRRARPLLVTALLALAMVSTVRFYDVYRMETMKGLYGIERADLAPFVDPSAQQYTPALIVVHPGHWTDYGALLELEDPFMDTPFVFVYSRGLRADNAMHGLFPDRQVYHYYPHKEKWTFFDRPVPGW